MRKYWISNSEIVGIAQEDCNPEGFESVEGVEAELQEIYFDGKRVVKKPDKPSENHFWDAQNKAWCALKLLPISSPSSRWNDFLIAIIQTATYEKIKNFFGANDPTEYTVLVALLNNSALPDTDRERLLENALRRAKAAMKGSSTPLTSKDVATINGFLASKLLVEWNLNG